MKNKKFILSMAGLFCLMTTGIFAALVTSNDFETFPLSQGWWMANPGKLTTDQNHTAGGTTSYNTSSSVSYTTQLNTIGLPVLPLTNGLLDFWYYVDPAADVNLGGESDALELFLRDDTGLIASQTWFRKQPGLREYVAGGLTVTLPGSADVSSMNGWNHVRIEYDYVAGIYDVTLNDSYTWRAPSFGLPDGMTGTGIVSYTWIHKNNNGAEIYLDDVNFIQAPVDCNDVFVKGYGFDTDLNHDCHVNPGDLGILSNEWLDCSDPDNPGCGGATPPPGSSLAQALPGHYVVSVKAWPESNDRFCRLGMYTFEANNTITTKSWTWSLLGGGTDSLSDRMIGDGIDDPPGNSDEDKFIRNPTLFLGPESNLTSLDGDWSQNGRIVNIDFSDGSWEKWYLTWEEPDNLYKMEMYAASYLKTGTNCWLTSTFTEASRDPNAPSGGFAFSGGVNGHDFTFAAPVAAIQKNHIGCALSFNTGGAPVDVVYTNVVAGIASDFHWTTNDVARLTYFGNGHWVYAYYSMPVSNPGILARRVIYQSTHDFNDNGNVEDEFGHQLPGLQIIDAAGQYRGRVGIQWSPVVPWVQALFWLDTQGTSQSAPSRTAVAQGELFIESDINTDLYVNMKDFTLLAIDWLRCNEPTNDPNNPLVVGCEANWLDF